MPRIEGIAPPRWHERLKEIPSEIDRILIPSGDGNVAQDEEWCDVVIAGKRQRIRFHDYHELYEIPGLYEQLFYRRLKCCSPSRTVALLLDVLRDSNDQPHDLNVLDLGAGNGMVGDELLSYGCVNKLVGIDILPEAKMATQRDRPGVYDEYHVTDLAELSEENERRLRASGFNCLTSVAALGFGDIPPQAFIKALDLIETSGWIAVTIKEGFLHERDTSGFSKLIRQLNRDETIQVQAYRRFCHRLSITGEPLYYVALVARKLQDVPDALFDD